jgi:hypothetical protein
VNDSDDCLDVTIAPPAAGAAPLPPSELHEVFAPLAVIQADPRAAQDRLRAGFGATRRLAVAAFGGRYAPSAHGLSARETARWAQEIRATLSGPQRDQLLEYVHTCREWERALRDAIDRGKADWLSDSARYAVPSAAEDAVADILTAVGIPVQGHARVAEEEVRRRWGDPTKAIWLRWAHRDRAYLLRIAIELDGQYLHLHGEQEENDRERDQILADRGWYVAQLSGSSMPQNLPRPVRERLTALVEQHRRAIVLARADLPALRSNLA